MAYEQRDGDFKAWTAEKKSERAPDFTGKGLYQGQQVRIALWKKTDRNGNTFLSGTIQPDGERDRQAAPPRPEPQAGSVSQRAAPGGPAPSGNWSDKLSDDVPFGPQVF